jgi:hypothetical protein
MELKVSSVKELQDEIVLVEETIEKKWRKGSIVVKDIFV